ncbi:MULTISPECIES: hypothetical protein [unclassified Rickettsia]|uniref:hypothetical protein n=1 Tax=unclassified Rickettsia TaxID=114295 RepID=UPI00313319F2
MSILLINEELGIRSFIWKRARRLEADNRSVQKVREDYQQKTLSPIFQIKRVYTF